MFEMTGPQSAKSSTGYSWKFLKIDEAEYTEEARSMSIFIEDGITRENKTAVIVHTNYICRWNPPFDSEAITPSKKEEIIENIRDIISFMNLVPKIRL